MVVGVSPGGRQSRVELAEQHLVEREGKEDAQEQEQEQEQKHHSLSHSPSSPSPMSGPLLASEPTVATAAGATATITPTAAATRGSSTPAAAAALRTSIGARPVALSSPQQIAEPALQVAFSFPAVAAVPSRVPPALVS